MTSSAVAAPLRGRAILVTRPVHQAEKLAGLIRDAGGEPVLFAALAVAALTDTATVRSLLSGLAAFDLAIFISPNAVEQGLALLEHRWPSDLPAAAVGEGTAAAARKHGIETIAAPVDRADSESLLAMPQLHDLRGKRVVIFRGEGGRELLGEQIRRRGAELSYAECYRRVRPSADPSALIARWEQGSLHAATVMSSETLENLWAMLGERGQRLLRSTPLLMPHASIAERASRLGLTEVAVTPPGDDGILRGLTAWFSLQAR